MINQLQIYRCLVQSHGRVQATKQSHATNRSIAYLPTDRGCSKSSATSQALTILHHHTHHHHQHQTASTSNTGWLVTINILAILAIFPPSFICIIAPPAPSKILLMTYTKYNAMRLKCCTRNGSVPPHAFVTIYNLVKRI